MSSKLKQRLFDRTGGVISDIVIAHPLAVTGPVIGQSCLENVNWF